jgi:hypothetical protein
MKGFAIMTDALVAASFFMLAMIIISSQSYQPKVPSSIYLKHLSMDITTVLEKAGYMETVMNGNSTGLQEIMERLPRAVCMQVSIINSTGGTEAYSARSGCTDTAGLDIQVVVRPLQYNGSSYIARAESWFRKEED